MRANPRLTAGCARPALWLQRAVTGMAPTGVVPALTHCAMTSQMSHLVKCLYMTLTAPNATAVVGVTGLRLAWSQGAQGAASFASRRVAPWPFPAERASSDTTKAVHHGS